MSGDRFLSRWSRMKSKSRAGGALTRERPRPAQDPTESAWKPAATADPPVATRPERATPPPEEIRSADHDPGDEEAVLADWPEDLPRPEELTEESDLSGFFSPEVSEAVRNLALRRLWRLNPVFANVDGLVDYGEDFTDAATVVANMKSAYQVGKGYRRDEPEPEPDADEPADAVAEDDSVVEAQVAEAAPQEGEMHDEVDQPASEEDAADRSADDERART